MVHSIPHYRSCCCSRSRIQNVYVNQCNCGWGGYATQRANLFMGGYGYDPYARAAEIQAEAMKDGVKWQGISNLITSGANAIKTIGDAIKGWFS